MGWRVKRPVPTSSTFSSQVVSTKKSPKRIDGKGHTTNLKRDLETDLVNNLKQQVSLLQQERSQLRKHIDTPPPPPPPPQPRTRTNDPWYMDPMIPPPANASDLPTDTDALKMSPQRSRRYDSEKENAFLYKMHAQKVEDEAAKGQSKLAEAHETISDLRSKLTLLREDHEQLKAKHEIELERRRESTAVESMLAVSERNTKEVTKERDDLLKAVNMRETDRLSRERDLIRVGELEEEVRLLRMREVDARQHVEDKEAHEQFYKEECAKKDESIVDLRRQMAELEMKVRGEQTNRVRAAGLLEAADLRTARLEETVGKQAEEILMLQQEALRRQQAVQHQTERLIKEVSYWDGSMNASVSKIANATVVASASMSPRRALRQRSLLSVGTDLGARTPTDAPLPADVSPPLPVPLHAPSPSSHLPPGEPPAMQSPVRRPLIGRMIS